MTDQNRMARYSELAAIILSAVSVISLISTLFIPTMTFGTPVVMSLVLLIVVLCICHAVATKGWQKALGFSALSFVISWVVEFIGCNYGWWFGDYGYTNAMGVSIGHVPIMIVLSWEAVIYPSMLLVDEFLSGLTSTKKYMWIVEAAFAALATALVATVWDLMADPVSVHLGYWSWDFGGAYMKDLAGGIPFSNYWGWIEAVFIISFLYRTLFARSHTSAGNGAAVSTKPRSTLVFAIALYTTWYCSASYNLIHLGFFEPVFIGFFSMGTIVLLGWGRVLFRQRV